MLNLEEDLQVLYKMVEFKKIPKPDGSLAMFINKCRTGKFISRLYFHVYFSALRAVWYAKNILDYVYSPTIHADTYFSTQVFSLEQFLHLT